MRNKVNFQTLYQQSLSEDAKRYNRIYFAFELVIKKMNKYENNRSANN